MASIIELRFEWPVGQATFQLTQAEALKVAVALRNLGLGLTLKGTQAMVTKNTARFSTVENMVQKMRRSV